MTCSNTPQTSQLSKIRTKFHKRVARISGLQMRRQEARYLNRGRAKRAGKAQRILNEAKAFYKNVRALAGLVDPALLSEPREHRSRSKASKQVRKVSPRKDER